MNTCQRCNKEMRRATKNDMYGLQWISPDEIWLCPRCLNEEERGIVYNGQIT